MWWSAPWPSDSRHNQLRIVLNSSRIDASDTMRDRRQSGVSGWIGSLKDNMAFRVLFMSSFFTCSRLSKESVVISLESKELYCRIAEPKRSLFVLSWPCSWDASTAIVSSSCAFSHTLHTLRSLCNSPKPSYKYDRPRQHHLWSTFKFANLF